MKSLVPLLDVVRCIKYMADRTDINREMFHLSKESMTVKEVAEICKKFNPKLNIIETDDEIPNLGYTISNKEGNCESQSLPPNSRTEMSFG